MNRRGKGSIGMEGMGNIGKGALFQALLSLGDMQEDKRKVLGKLSSSVVNRLDMHDSTTKELMKAHAERVQAKMSALEKELNDEYQKSEEWLANMVRHDAIWNEIYDEVGLDKEARKGRHSVNQEKRQLLEEPMEGNTEHIECPCGCGRELSEEELADRRATGEIK